MKVGEFFVSRTIQEEAKDALIEFLFECRAFILDANPEPWSGGTRYVAECNDFEDLVEGLLPNKYDLQCMVESGEYRFRFDLRQQGEPRTVWLNREKPKEEPVPIATKNISKAFSRW